MAETDVIRGKVGFEGNVPTILGARKFHSMGIPLLVDSIANHLTPALAPTRTIYIKGIKYWAGVIPISAGGTVLLTIAKRTGATTVNVISTTNIDLEAITTAYAPVSATLTSTLANLTLAAGDVLIATATLNSTQGTQGADIGVTVEYENAD